MNQRRKTFLAAIVASTLLVVPAVGWSQEGDVLRLRDGASGARGTAFVDDEAALAEEVVADRWIGVHVTELPPVLKNHLKLEHGVLAESIMPDSPAEQAGIANLDVLLTIEGENITRPEDVRDAVQAADEGQQLTLEILHEGEKKSIRIVPAQRPDITIRRNPTATPSGAASSQQEFLRHQHQAMKALERALADRQAAGMMFMRPGIVTQKPIELPEGVSVTIVHRRGEKSVVVERGGERWEVTPETLNKLPDELQAPVASILSCGVPLKLAAPHRDVIRLNPDAAVRVETHPPKVRVEQGPSAEEAKMDAVLKELKQVRKQLDALQNAVKSN